MPIHDWTRVTAGTFHAFHLSWLGTLQGAMNNSVLPEGFYALAEQVAAGVGPDVLTLSNPGHETSGPGAPVQNGGGGGGALAVAEAPPRMAVHDAAPEESLMATRRRRRIVVRTANGDDAVAVLEVVSPWNKSGEAAVDQFVAKAVDLLRGGLHVQVIDLFPPGRFDPDGLHAAIWSELGGDYRPRPHRPLTVASYVAGDTAECYVEPTAVGLPLVDLPLFLTPEKYVNVPLEATYMAAYSSMPARWRDVIEGRTSA